MPLEQIALPSYTRKQEWWNSMSHLAGVVFALIAGPFMIVKSTQKGDILSLLAVCIYLFSMVVLYSGSALYHGLRPGNAKKVFRVLDHDNVFFLIMGSYTPYTWIALRSPEDGFPWGWVIFASVWTLCILGIVFNSINIKKHAKLSMLIYVGVGSLILIAFYPLYFAIGIPGILTLLFSGVLFWIGAMLYGLGGKKSYWYHTVFHFFILAATTLMFFSIYFFVL
ncbi:MAG: hemolysin III family protein [Candidatus Enteromonas sp.]|nr:hemolysin III family protein [Candidatus Enteromonas sp.]